MTDKAVFNHIASEYDATFTETGSGKLQREIVRRTILPLLQKNLLNILELNCGTGADAFWLSEMGHNVLGTDISGEMIGVCMKKNEKSTSNHPEFKVASFEEALSLDGEYDLIFSDFGGMNCISREKMMGIGQMIAGKLKPGGKCITVIMPAFCGWESFYFLLKFKWRSAFRRFSHGPVKAKLSEGHYQDTWYYSPSAIKKSWKNHLNLISKKPVGIFLPPSYLDPFFNKRPRFLKFLNRMEKRWGKIALFSGMADHCLLIFEKN